MISASLWEIFRHFRPENTPYILSLCILGVQLGLRLGSFDNATHYFPRISRISRRCDHNHGTHHNVRCRLASREGQVSGYNRNIQYALLSNASI